MVTDDDLLIELKAIRELLAGMYGDKSQSEQIITASKLK